MLVLVSEKFVDPAPVAEAATVYRPAVPFAVNTGAVATPEALVDPAAVFVPVPANVPLAPVDGAVNVTVTPERADESATFAFRAVVNAAFTVALWGVPAIGEIDAVVCMKISHPTNDPVLGSAASTIVKRHVPAL